MKISNLNLWKPINPKLVDPPQNIGRNSSGIIYLVAIADDDTRLVVVSDVPIDELAESEAWELNDLFNSQDPPELTLPESSQPPED